MMRLFNWLKKIAAFIDRCNAWIGKTISWLILFMTLLITYDVAMRYLFNSGSVAIQELEWHLFSILFLCGAAYTYQHNEHVRLDLFYQSKWLNDTQRAWIDIIGCICALLPFCCLVIFSAWPFVNQSFIHHEGSPDPGGLGARWVLKACIPLGFALLALQGIADCIKKFHILTQRNSTSV